MPDQPGGDQAVREILRMAERDEVPVLWSFQWAFDAGGFPDLVDWPDGADTASLASAKKGRDDV